MQFISNFWGKFCWRRFCRQLTLPGAVWWGLWKNYMLLYHFTLIFISPPFPFLQISMWLHLASLSYLPWCRTMDSFQFFTPLFPTLPGILISNRNVCEYAWEQIFWKTWRCFQDSWAFSLFSVENSLRHPWSLLRLPWASHRSSPQHSWWALRCFHFQLPFALFHGWNRHKSCWMNSKIQGHANSFNKQIWTTFGNKRLWHLEKHMSDVHTDSEQI